MRGKKSQITKFFVCHVPPYKILSKTEKCEGVKTPEFLCSFMLILLLKINEFATQGFTAYRCP